MGNQTKNKEVSKKGGICSMTRAQKTTVVPTAEHALGAGVLNSSVSGVLPTCWF